MGVLYVVPAPKAEGKTIELENLVQAKVLVVGGGGREAAIVDALSKSICVTKVYAAPGNPGMAAQAECVPIADGDIDGLLAFADEHHIDLTVVGPEVPLAKGIADAFTLHGLRIFGPSAAAARIESSKDFAKRLMAKHGVPTAAFRTFTDFDEAWDYVRQRPFPQVLKYDGLAAGKGVTIPQDAAEAEADLRSMLCDDKFGHGKVVVEDFLTGPEFSMMCLVDGVRVFPLALAQDHKRAFEGDKGPNTGGMGAYSPLPSITAEDEAWALEHIMKPVAEGLVAEGTPFKGLLYGGLMKTPSGIKVIEFNCRFGDPETEVVLPRLKSDFYLMLSAIVDGTAMPQIRWSDDATLGFVLASKGYPGPYTRGFGIDGLAEAAAVPGVRLYHMGTAFAPAVSGAEASGGPAPSASDNGPRILTAGGRVLMVVGSGPTLAAARDRAVTALSKIHCDNLFYRSDIGWQAL